MNETEITEFLQLQLRYYPLNTGIIAYRKPDGEESYWVIGASNRKDNEQSLREHLQRHHPDCEFLGCAIK